MSTVAMIRLDDATMEAAFTAVAKAFNVTAGQIICHRRMPPLCEARHALCHLLREETDGTFSEIGRRLHRDHGAIIHGADRAETLAEIDPRYAAKYEAAREAFLTATTGRRTRWPWL